ncbi:lamina-associated polypeptide 2, isoforms beta/gamma-like [Clarias magur]|uniref:Lamina-associated polypeptide 2, isoforms beta/gamma-like n=1 Tax=Clarias magur TaxID=1594786 RepID=A0A8J4UPI3_CLAMG|nr:lamina-associated polypeptide 2, isoforms beta/gamma-like [Clarias magur]
MFLLFLVMSSLSSKTSEELCKLLDEYGINHGPIVDSTRKLYEKKLTEAMSKRPKASPDKTYYREEQQEDPGPAGTQMMWIMQMIPPN